MSIRTGPEDIHAIEAIKSLTKGKKTKMFKLIAGILQAPRRIRPSVNLDKISRLSQPKSVVVVPGKVLGTGELNHAVDIVALCFSEQALKKIADAGGSTHSFQWLVERGAKDAILLK